MMVSRGASKKASAILMHLSARYGKASLRLAKSTLAGEDLVFSCALKPTGVHGQDSNGLSLGFSDSFTWSLSGYGVF